MSSQSAAISWRKCRPASEDGIPPYFYNVETGQSVWRLPDDSAMTEEDVPDFTSEDEQLLDSGSSDSSHEEPAHHQVEDDNLEVEQIVESFAPLPDEMIEHNSQQTLVEPPSADRGFSHRSNTLPARGRSGGKKDQEQSESYNAPPGSAPELGEWGCISSRSRNKSCIGDPDAIKAADQWIKQSTSSRGSIAGEPFFYNEVTGETSWDQPCTEAFEAVPEVSCDTQIFQMDVHDAVNALGFESNVSQEELDRLKCHCDVSDIYERVFQLAKLIENIGSDEEWVKMASQNNFALLRNMQDLLQPEAPPALLVAAVQAICLFLSLDFSLFANLCEFKSANVCELLGCAAYGITCALSDRTRAGAVHDFPSRAPQTNEMAGSRFLSLPQRSETAIISWAKLVDLLLTHLNQSSETPTSVNARKGLQLSGESANEMFWLRFIGIWMEMFRAFPHKTNLIGAVIQPTMQLFEWLKKTQASCGIATSVLEKSLKDSRWEYVGRAILYYVNEGLRETRSSENPLEQHIQLITATKTLRLLLQLPFDSPVMFSSDLNVLIDILLRDLEDLPETSKLRVDLLALLGEIISSRQWLNGSKYRLEDIHDILRRFVDVAEGALEYPEEIRNTAEAIFRENMETLKE